MLAVCAQLSSDRQFLRSLLVWSLCWFCVDSAGLGCICVEKAFVMFYHGSKGRFAFACTRREQGGHSFCFTGRLICALDPLALGRSVVQTNIILGVFCGLKGKCESFCFPFFDGLVLEVAAA